MPWRSQSLCPALEFVRRSFTALLARAFATFAVARDQRAHRPQMAHALRAGGPAALADRVACAARRRASTAARDPRRPHRAPRAARRERARTARLCGASSRPWPGPRRARSRRCQARQLIVPRRRSPRSARRRPPPAHAAARPMTCDRRFQRRISPRPRPYCYPLTISDLCSRYVLTVTAYRC